jgi:CheY-like chemotaxis protein
MRGYAAAGALGMLFEPTAPMPVSDIMTYSADASAWGDLRDMRVLLVDHNAADRRLVTELLEEVGVRVLGAENGRIALDHLAGERVDLVLMDLRMPLMDGYELTRRVRQMPELAGMPVVAMTAHAVLEARECCLAAGMNDVFAKPVERERLYTILLAYRRATRVADPTLAAQVPGPVDEAVGLRYAGNKPALYLRLLRRFRETQHDLVARLDAAREHGDLVESCRLAHTLKSTAATVGATRLSALAKAMEADTEGGRYAVSVESCAALAVEFEAVMAWIAVRLETSSAP